MIILMILFFIRLIYKNMNDIKNELNLKPNLNILIYGRSLINHNSAVCNNSRSVMRGFKTGCVANNFS